MFITEHVDLPLELIRAQEQKELAVFAGAGVSMGPPSRLPGFHCLAEQVAGGTRKPEEPLDRFLGQLETGGVHVHDRVCEIIDSPSSEANLLHRGLLSLFRENSEVRLVTTNFDRHFTTASKDIFGTEPETFCAPALPLGNNFSGIVYLHGAVQKGPSSLIVTDRDFGRAYLTEGWASRFLLPFYLEYTVLFVGYSHNDPVLSYIARGLPPGTARFALSESSDDEHWRLLGVTPVHYPRISGPNEHQRLSEAVGAWARYIRMDALEHRSRIKRIASSEPPKEPVEIDYVRRVLEDISLTKIFAKEANSAEWMEWVADEPAFDALFEAKVVPSEISQALARWFALHFVTIHPDAAMGVVVRKKRRLHSYLWSYIAWTLANEGIPSTSTIDKWLVVLLSHVPEGANLEHLVHLLINKGPAVSDAQVVLVFERLFEPRVIVRRDLGFGFDDTRSPAGVEAEVSLGVREYWLTECWKKAIHPRIPGIWRWLVPLLEAYLARANLTIRGLAKADDDYDGQSFRRSAIEPDEQDKYRGEFDPLIDAARDTVEWLVENETIGATHALHAWSESGIPILRRVAVHGMRLRKDLSPDQKMEWLLDMGYVLNTSVKHEVFMMLREVYGTASGSFRTQLCGVIDERLERIVRDQNSDPGAYEIFNLLLWLHEAAPKCSATSDRLERITKIHPEWQRRERPDLDKWMTAVRVGGPESPFSLNDVLQMVPEDVTGCLGKFADEPVLFDAEEGFLDMLAQACRKDFDWSFCLASTLASQQDFNPKVWPQVLLGWTDNTFSEIQWQQVLSIIAEHKELSTYSERIASLLVSALRKRDSNLVREVLATAEDYSFVLYERTVAPIAPQCEEAFPDWLMKAINTSAGKLAEFWLQALSRRRSSTEADWKGIPDNYRIAFDRIIDRKNGSDQLALTVLGSNAHFLVSLDPEWSKTRLIPLFDLTRGKEVAEKLWHGFATWGKWNPVLTPLLIPYYRQYFSFIPGSPPGIKEGILQHAATLALFGSSDPVHDGWLDEMIRLVDEDSLRQFAWDIQSGLDGLSDSEVKSLWNRWLKTYWRKRIQGMPRPLTGAETAVMLNWAADLEPVIPDVADLLDDMTAGDFSNTHLFHSMAERGIASREPIAVSRIILFALSGTYEFFDCRDAYTILAQLKAAGVEYKCLRELCNRLMKHGCHDFDRFLA